MICFPNAKINLGLNIVSRRPDGYHDIETVFYPIGLKDALEIVPMSENADTKEEFRLFQSGIEIGGNDDDNLIIKALKLLKKEREIPALDIHLLKKIPFGAGLGGGSSNAAYMLKLLNNSFELGFSECELTNFAAKLGADCPFFIKNRPVFATGTGNQMKEIELDLSQYLFVLIKPDVYINTAWAYSMITPQIPDISLLDITKSPMEEWVKLMKNDFEVPIFKKYPEICTIKKQLYDKGAIYASMSGSGSSVYGFFKEKPDINEISKNRFVWTNIDIQNGRYMI